MKILHTLLVLVTYIRLSKSTFLDQRANAREVLTRANSLQVISSNRLLRGGKSSGRGGSSGFSGGRSNIGGSRNFSTGARIFAGVAALGIGLLALGFLFPAAFAGFGLAPCLAACCCGLGLASAANASKQSGSGNNNGNNMAYGNSNQVEMNSSEFSNRVNQTKAEVESRSEGLFAPPNPPRQGRYTTSFRDPESGIVHGATLDLYFEQRGSYPYGYRISGKGSDIDGETIIEDGHSNFDGTAWWRERTITGDVGLLVLSTGKFDFERGTFVGTWLANSMINGPYMSFTISEELSPSAPLPIAESTTSSNDIPLATATVISTEYKN